VSTVAHARQFERASDSQKRKASAVCASARTAAGSSRHRTKRPGRLSRVTRSPEIHYSMDRTQIIERALGLAQAVAGFVAGARQFFHAVMLYGHRCPRCGGSLQMEREGQCRCRGCGDIFDPTAAFQRCPACGGSARLRIRRYECVTCHTEVVSRFLFDGRVFDAAYFRQKMAEYRRRKRELRNRVRQMLSGTRSNAIAVPPAELAGVPGLLEALNSLTAGTEAVLTAGIEKRFDLHRYQKHIQAHLQLFPTALDDLPPLSENRRLDRIWRFVAIIFLAHAGLVNVWQEGENILVKQREADREGSDVPGDSEQADGVEGPVGRAEA